MLLHIPLALIGRKVKTSWRLAGILFQNGVKCLLFIQPWLKIKRDVKLPKYDRPIVLISNHRSHLDVFYFLSAVPNIRVLAKKSFFKIPFFGLGLKLLRLIPIVNDDFDVYRKALKTAKDVLLNLNDPVIFFPEMTRCEEGFKGLGKFSLAPFQVAFETKATVVPFVILGNDKAWPKGTFGGRFRRPTLLKSLPHVEASDFKSARALQKFVRIEMEEALNKDWDKYYSDSTLL